VTTEHKVKMAKLCLALIRDIAARGARSENPEHIGYALQEISQALIERTGTEERYFEPVPAGQISGLEALKEDLDIVDCSSQDLAALETGSGNGFTAFGNSLN
jgi:hypothetical protein